MVYTSGHRVPWSRESCLSKWMPTRRQRRGLTLIELVVIVAIVMTLTIIGIPAYDKYRENTRIAQAVVDIRVIEHDILIQEAYAGRLPNSLNEIGKQSARDPWSNSYQYFNLASGAGNGVRRFDKSAAPLNTDFDLYSGGRDGRTDTSITDALSLDDIVRGRNMDYVGVAAKY